MTAMNPFRSALPLLFLVAAASASAAAQGPRPRSLGDVEALLRSGVSGVRIAALAARDCVSFAADSASVRRLTAAGADQTLLDGLRTACVRAAEDPPQAPPTTPAALPSPAAPAPPSAVSTAPYEARARLSFFERGVRAPPLSQRVLTTRFARSSTRFVGVMAELAYTPPPATVHATLVCTYLLPNGAPLDTTELHLVLSSGGGTARDAGGVGFEEPGSWRRGTYGVVCSLNGVAVGRGRFTIE